MKRKTIQDRGSSIEFFLSLSMIQNNINTSVNAILMHLQIIKIFKMRTTVFNLI